VELLRAAGADLSRMRPRAAQNAASHKYLKILSYFGDGGSDGTRTRDLRRDRPTL
jgi:hypothetical protein